MFIYKITNDVNDKVYVGQTIKTIESRFKDHIGDAKKGSTYPLHVDMRTLGYDKFHIYKLAEANSLDELDRLEDFYIQKLNAMDLGYNQMGGGRLGYHNPMDYPKAKQRHDDKMRSEEVRSKISKTLRQYYQDNHDSPVEIEHRRKLSEQKKQLYASPRGEEVKAKQRASFKFTPEHYYAINSAKYKPVYCTDTNGKVIKTFKCVKDASKWWYDERGYHHYKPPLDDYIKKSFDKDIFIDDIHWYYGEPCAESIES